MLMNLLEVALATLPTTYLHATCTTYLIDLLHNQEDHYARQLAGVKNRLVKRDGLRSAFLAVSEHLPSICRSSSQRPRQGTTGFPPKQIPSF
jgi:hypothetical protein